VVQGEAVGARDVVVLDPAFAGAVRARDHQPVQGGDEDGGLEGKAEAAPGGECRDHVVAAGLLPQSPEEQWGADTAEREPGSAGEGREEKGLVAESGACGEQALQLS
jgi:hypothetical protein